MRKGIGSHQSAKMLKDEWLTPPSLLEKLGNFDLDPCSAEEPPWEIAPHFYTKKDDGLYKIWFGRVFCNPPYGANTGKWLNKLAAHGNGIALIFARTETKFFFDQVWEKADALFFFKGRLYFHHLDGTKATANAGAPSVLVAYGDNNAKTLENLGIKGKYIKL